MNYNAAKCLLCVGRYTYEDSYVCVCAHMNEFVRSFNIWTYVIRTKHTRQYVTNKHINTSGNVAARQRFCWYALKMLHVASNALRWNSVCASRSAVMSFVCVIQRIWSIIPSSMPTNQMMMIASNAATLTLSIEYTYTRTHASTLYFLVFSPMIIDDMPETHSHCACSSSGTDYNVQLLFELRFRE